MTTEELPEVTKDDDLLIQVGQFKNGLIARATGGGFEDDEYKRIRKLILGLPEIGPLIPTFLRGCRTPDEFWGYISGEAGTYKERRTIIAHAINPILDYLEEKTGIGALEFNNNYEEKEIIGQGGFGLVYLYEHLLLKIPFAVKIFAPAFYEGNQGELERFFQEARMLFKLNHPSIIKVYDAGLIGKRPFIRMEYFDGLNLNQALIKYGILSIEKSLTMIENIVDGLRFAHEEIGIIHRDLKPSNIMVAKPNQFRIIDFGLGIFIENELHSRITKTGENVISGYYNAPELVENPKLIDKKSDIYSIGAIWFTMLTGQPPAGTTITRQLRGIEGMKKNYMDCLSRCLASIDERYSDCQELLNDIYNLKE